MDTRNTDTRNVVAAAPPDDAEIAEQDEIAAMRYIDAIVAREPGGPTSASAADLRRALWDRFVAEYRTVSTGPYARRGGAALRLALARI